MRVAICAQGNDIESLVDPRFGRARWLIFAETETDDWRPCDSHSLVEASGRPGVRVESVVVERGAGAVVAGNVGPRAYEALNEAGIPIYQVGNGISAREALRALRQGDLTALAGPTIHGPWSRAPVWAQADRRKEDHVSPPR